MSGGVNLEVLPDLIAEHGPVFVDDETLSPHARRLMAVLGVVVRKK